jgi:hypothetical protein
VGPRAVLGAVYWFYDKSKLQQPVFFYKHCNELLENIFMLMVKGKGKVVPVL